MQFKIITLLKNKFLMKANEDFKIKSPLAFSLTLYLDNLNIYFTKLILEVKIVLL